MKLSPLLLALHLATFARGEVRLHALFSDHLILQRESPLPVWGEAAPGEKVAVFFADQNQTTVADSSGRWRVTLAPLAASAEPRELVVRGSNTLTVRDVLVGDVFLAGGQSNMGSPLSSGATAALLPKADDPHLRFFNVKTAVAAAPLPQPAGRWLITNPDNAKGFSAVAYIFASEIRRTQKVPVGILQAAWGGTPIKTWMSLESLRRDPPVTATLAEWDAAYAKHLANRDHPERLQAYYRDLKEWDETVNPSFRAARRAHDEEMAMRRASGLPTKPSPQPSRPAPESPDPTAMPAPSLRPTTPTIAYNGMIAPLAPFALRAFLWYQGEADGSKGADYRVWFPRLIEGWRATFGQGDLPFLFVQLPACYKDPKPVAEGGWPLTREAQAMTLSVPRTAMAVTLDIGDPDDVHPDNKLHVGQRLALAGRKLVYGETISASGPLYRSHTVEGATVRIQFSHTDDGLTIGSAPWRPKNASPLPTDRLLGFFIAGADRRWFPAEARINGESVIVASPEVTAPAAVRYGWHASPQVNLYNGAGLPAAPFRTDDWPR